MKKWFSSTIPNDPRMAHDALRRFIEGEGTSEEHETIRLRINESEAWREEYARIERYVASLRQLPAHTPPERVWNRIAARIETVTPKRVWFPWYYARPAWATGMRMGSFVLVAAITLTMLMPGNISKFDQGFEIISVEEINGFGPEAETYIAYHDLKNVSAESLIAFNADDWPQ